MSHDVEISVIIASYNDRRAIPECLRSLERQRTERSYEVIVVDSSADGTADLVEREFPAVRLLRQRERKFPGDARNIGVRAATGPIIAFIDSDCVAAADWVEAVAAAHDSTWPGVGGGIANGNPESYVGWGAYFCEFSQWLPDQPANEMDDMPTANLSYKRELFERYGGFIEGTYCSDTDFNWRIGREGHRLLYSPLIQVAHSNIDSFGAFVRHEFFHGRSFGRVRVKAQRFSVGKRAAYITLSPLILAKLILHRSLKNCANPVYLPQFLKASPLLALGLACWTLGEVIGYAGR